MKKISAMMFAVALAAPLMLNAEAPLQSGFPWPGRALQGYAYGDLAAPSGNEWQSPGELGYNKMMPRAVYYSFNDKATAAKVLPEFSPRVMSLDGEWAFHWAPTPDQRPADFYKAADLKGWDRIRVPSNWNIAGLQPDGSQKYGKPIYVNQPVIFMHEIKPGDWKKGVMRTPPESWTTYKDRNEVGSYFRLFTLPKNWKGEEVYIAFDGVDSFFYLWINGKYVGFSKNSRNVARFDITKYLNKPGESNTVAVEVYRNSDGSFLEAQDMFRLPGIFRSVRLEATPKVHIADMRLTPVLRPDGDAVVKVSLLVRNLSDKNIKNLNVDLQLKSLKLYTDESCCCEPINLSLEGGLLAKGAEKTLTAEIPVPAPRLWSAEIPNRYLFTATLLDKRREIETVSAFTGIRSVEVKDVEAKDDEFGQGGRFFLVNGKPVKLRGVDRHETDPSVGHAISRDRMVRDIMAMKANNINHVRNSHYPDDPYWYYLTDRYGIYLTDEANLESHEYYYWDASLSHPVEWAPAHVGRNVELVASRFNYPSVVMWSLGNEAGPGDNFRIARDSVRTLDLSRPVHYERNNDIADVGSNMYPSVKWVREAVKGADKDIKYPFYICEYAHSMGNALGNFKDYWDAINSTNHFMGGAIWDWVDQSLYNYDPTTGARYLAYGGDFGDTPNDGQFVMNGIMNGDLTPKPQLAEVKKVYQPVEFTLVRDADNRPVAVRVFNRNYFRALDDVRLRLDLQRDGDTVGEYVIDADMPVVMPRESKTVSFDKFVRVLADKNIRMGDTDEFEYLGVALLNRAGKPWAKAGHVLAEEQFDLTKASANAAASVNHNTKKGKIDVTFNTSTGIPVSLKINGREMVHNGKGLRLDAFRAFVNNDNWLYKSMYDLGLNDLRHKVIATSETTLPDGTDVIAFTVESQAPTAYNIEGSTSVAHVKVTPDVKRPMGKDDFKFITNYVWTMPADESSLSLRAVTNSNKPETILPRIGLSMEVDGAYDGLTYFGRGPVSNYRDRKTSQNIAMYESRVMLQFENFAKPQNMANHEDTRFVELVDAHSGAGIDITSPGAFSFTVLPFSEEELVFAGHPYELPQSDRSVLHLDAMMTGLGGNSCGQGAPLAPDRVKAGLHTFAFDITAPDGLGLKKSRRDFNAVMPLAIDRNAGGLMTIVDAGNPAGDGIFYSIDGGKAQKYHTPVALPKGGTVTAWRAAVPKMKFMMSFLPVPEPKEEKE